MLKQKLVMPCHFCRVGADVEKRHSIPKFGRFTGQSLRLCVEVAVTNYAYPTTSKANPLRYSVSGMAGITG
jgi:hypothetical protein